MDLSWKLNSSDGAKKNHDLESTSTSVIIKDGIVAIALGIVSDPPTLVLIYETEVSGKRKKRKRRMPLRNFNDRSNVTKTVFGLRKRHSEYLESVPSVTLEKMARIIQEVQKGLHVDEAVVKVHQEYEINPNQDLNKLSTLELSKKKEIMEESYVKSLVKPGDPGYLYNKQVNFEKRGRRSSIWDDEDSDEEADPVPATTIIGATTSDSKTDTESTETKILKIESNDDLNSSSPEVVQRSESIKAVSGEDNQGLDVENIPKFVSEAEAGKIVNAEEARAQEFETDSKFSNSSVYDDDEIDDEDFW